MILYCATTNKGKLREFQAAAEKLGRGIEVRLVPELESIDAPEETGATFAENAALKAIYYSGFAPGPVFADDSGLAVDALNGEPGVFSARFSGDGATDESNNDLLLERMKGVVQRSAKFVCVIALAEKGKLIETFEGEVAGALLSSRRGSGGFGYDPLFYYAPLSKTLAELTEEEKLSVSHRGQALDRLFEWLSARESASR